MKREFYKYEFLSTKWFEITKNSMLENKFNCKEFILLFKETYDVIKQYSTCSTIDREIMDLIFNISGFVATRQLKIGFEHSAATELTEAMLHCCLYEEAHDEIVTKGEWYIFSDIILDFTNPEETLFNIVAHLDNWCDLRWCDFEEE